MKLTDKAYNILKWVVIIALPAIGTLYSTLADIWGIPYGDAILRTASALALCIGSLIGISNITYKKSSK